MNYRIDKKQAFNLVGLAKDTTIQECTIETPKLWNSFLEQWENIPGRIKGECCGLCKILSEDGLSFNYTVGLAVDGEELPEGMILKKIAEKNYFIFTHTGPVITIEKTYKEIMKEGMKETGKNKINLFG